jgi:hypothetical protein
MQSSSGNSRVFGSWCVFLVGLGMGTTVSIRVAHADYEDDKNKKQMGVVERAFAKFQKDPSLFDGKALAAGADLQAASGHANACDEGTTAYDHYAPAISPKGKSSDQWKKLTALYQERKPWCTALRTAVQGGQASADDAQNAKHLATIDSALIQKDLKIFNGTKLGAGVSPEAGTKHSDACENGIKTYERTFPSITAAGQSSAAGKKVTARYQEMKPWCASLRTAVSAAYTQVRADADANYKANQERDRLCRTQAYAISDAVGTGYMDLLDTWRGSRTPGSAEDITKFRTQLDKLVEVCKGPSYADFATRCKGTGSIDSSATNQRFDHGELCVPAADPKATMTAVLMRIFQNRQGGGSSEPELAYLKTREGWISTTQPVEYATYFKVSEETKKKATEEITALFKAAGVPAPADLSVLWAQQQKSKDEQKAAVDQTAPEWKLEIPKCAHYGCKLAEKGILKAHKKAKIKRVLATANWTIVKKPNGVPESQYNSVRVVYQIPGEPHCQVRQTTVSEVYKGGGKYQKATSTVWGFVRWQSCAN